LLSNIDIVILTTQIELHQVPLELHLESCDSHHHHFKNGNKV